MAANPGGVARRALMLCAGLTASAACLTLLSSPSAALPERLAARVQPAAPSSASLLASAENKVIAYKPVLASKPHPAYYRNPLRSVSGLVAQRIDAGVDYAGSGPVYALGTGVIVMVYDSGWPGGVFICEHITQGRLAGRYVYVAEGVRPYVSIGERVTSATRLGWLYGGLETGWAAPPPYLSDPMSKHMYEYSFPTAEGRRYSWLLHRLGAPAGRAQSVSAHLLSVHHRRLPRRLRAFDWAVANAKGCWYAWGGAGPCSQGYDCSGLVMAAYAHVGIYLPHNTQMMVDSGKLVQISPSQARRGDIVMWFSGGTAFHTELVAHLTSWTFGAHDTGTRVGAVRTWGAYHVFYRVR